ncbi:glycoside hydrolase family 18 protein [Gilvimarinus agarilyticus]|uniref:hypothetical protein n=1 Tax=Gilvimarinus agarilyticus TaxID=679259 RepID=UPI00059FABDA|nr:hypothetical protein [Gilvimarinus agarilyticus]
MRAVNIAAYCSGDFGPGKCKTHIQDVQQSGLTTIILWSMHLGRAGDVNPSGCQAIAGQSWGELVFNDGDIRIVDDETFNPNNDPEVADWPHDLLQMKQNGSHVSKIFISIGGWRVCDFQTIEYMLEHGMQDVLRRNFQTLRDAFTIDGQCLIDGIDLDNEEPVKANTITEFSQMLFELGFEVTFCPYSNPVQWQGYMQTLWDKGYKVSWWNLQCYSGGAENLDPDELERWVDALSQVVGKGRGAAYLVAGLAVRGANDSNPQECPFGLGGVCESLASVSQYSLAGGFLWKYDSVLSNAQPCSGVVPHMSDYTGAIREGLAKHQPATSDTAVYTA